MEYTYKKDEVFQQNMKDFIARIQGFNTDNSDPLIEIAYLAWKRGKAYGTELESMKYNLGILYDQMLETLDVNKEDLFDKNGFRIMDYDKIPKNGKVIFLT